MAVELFFDVQVVHMQHAGALLLVSVVDLFVHGFFLNDVFGDVEGSTGAFLVQHGCSVGGFQTGIEAAVFATRGRDKGTVDNLLVL